MPDVSTNQKLNSNLYALKKRRYSVDSSVIILKKCVIANRRV